MNLTELQAVIDLAWEARAEISAVNSPEVRDAVEHVIDELNAGRVRVAERRDVGEGRAAGAGGGLGRLSRPHSLR